jgi:CheY-like chemotaxis protein
MIPDKIKAIFTRNSANKQIRILVIEDNKVDQMVACRAIERGGYTTLKANDGTTGIVMTKEHLPDLILLDYELPDMNGPEVCHNLKADQATNQIPVLFLTGMKTPQSIVNCYQEGGANYLAKPINPRFLLQQIDLALKDREI